MLSAADLASSSSKKLINDAPQGQRDQISIGVTQSALQAYYTNQRDQNNGNKGNGSSSDTVSAAIGNAFANAMGTMKEEDQKSIRAALDKSALATNGITLDQQKKSGERDSSGKYLSVPHDAQTGMKPFLQDLIDNGSQDVKNQATAMMKVYDKDPKAAMAGFQANTAPAPFLASMNPGMLARLQADPLGQSALKQFTVSGETINAAVANSADPFAQMGGANALNTVATQQAAVKPIAGESKADALNRGFQGTIDVLGAFQRAVGDAGNATSLMAAAAQTSIQAQQTNQEKYQTQGETAKARVGSYKSAVAAIDAGDHSFAAQTRVTDTAASVQQSGDAAYQKGLSILYAKRDMDLSTQRSNTAYDLQRSRSQTAFNLQNTYNQDDFDRQRQISDDAYNLSRQHAQRDFDIQRKESYYQFYLQRQRAEVEFNHQVVVMGKAAAKSVYDVYARVKVEQTWSAASLISNMADQQRRLAEQQANLAKVRQMGLSGDVIQQLGLNDPSKSQQLARMVNDLVNNPAMIKTFNDGIKTRIDAAGKVVTDQDNAAWQEMTRGYKLNMDQGMTDFLHGLGVQNAALAQSFTDQRVAYQLSIDLSIESFNKNRNRQLLSFNLGMAQMAKDHKTVMDQARENFNLAYTEITGDFGTISKAAVNALDGTSKAQAKVLFDNVGSVMGQIYDTLKRLGLVDQSMLNPGAEFQVQSAQMGGVAPGPSRAEGGVIPGNSPHKKADNILIHATAGEYVQPVDTVQHYGIDFMDRLRRRQVRKEELDGYADGGLIWPTNTRQLSPSYPGHSGIDIAASMGAPIYAPMEGNIFYSGWDRGYGQAIFERFNAGLEAVFGHTSQVIIAAGRVAAGDVIGKVGSTGHSTGPHLHFEINDPGPFGNAADRDPSMRFLNGLKDGSSAMMAAGTGSTAVLTPAEFQTIIDNLPAVKTDNTAIAAAGYAGKLIPASLIASRMATKYTAQLTSSTGPMTAGSAGAQANQLIALRLLGQYGWGLEQMPALTQLWNNESGWNEHAKNPSSGAYGIPQSLPASKMGSIAADYLNNPETQIRWGLQYIKDRYGSPTATLSKWNTQHWYGDGGIVNGKQMIGVGEKGPEAVLPLNDKGASFLANVMSQMSSSETKKAMLQTGGTTTQASTMTYYQHVDKSTTFSGDISIRANDPNEFIRTLEAQQRMKALTGR